MTTSAHDAARGTRPGPFTPDLETFIRGIPKAELHLHIEGTLEPEMAFDLARRNNVTLPYASVEALRSAYRFTDLQSFLDVYYAGAAVLCQEQDFFDLTLAYLARARADGVVHIEIFFDPQTHTARGVPFASVIGGIDRALLEGTARWGISSRLILCFLRHLDEASAQATLEMAMPWRDRIDAIGLDSSENGNPPSKFERVFQRARTLGYQTVAHAGEEGPASYIWEALELLGVARIDHGVACESDPALMEYLRDKQIPLTVCPLSNVRLAVVADLEAHNLKRLLDFGLCVTVNSDDPAYFGGYVAANMVAVSRALGLGRDDIVKLARHSINASFLTSAQKELWNRKIDEYGSANPAIV